MWGGLPYTMSYQVQCMAIAFLSVAIHILINFSFCFRYTEKAHKALVDFAEHTKTIWG